jgi:hypothetical protein
MAKRPPIIEKKIFRDAQGRIASVEEVVIDAGDEVEKSAAAPTPSVEAITKMFTAIINKAMGSVGDVAAERSFQAARKGMLSVAGPLLEAVKERAKGEGPVPAAPKKRNDNTPWLEDYKRSGQAAEAERQARTTTAPAVDAVAEPAQPAWQRQHKALMAQLEALTKQLNDPAFVAGFQTLMRSRVLAVAKHAEAVQTLEGVNHDRIERGLAPFEFDVIRAWKPRI